MTTPRTLRVRLATGSAAGGLALAALTGLSAGTANAAAPAAPAAPAAQVAPAASSAAAAVGTTTVRNDRQLRRAVLRANKRSGKERIKLAKNIRLTNGRGNGNGPLNGDLDVTDDLVIVGKGRTINARGVDRIFDVRGSSRLVLQRVKLKNGGPVAGESGGAVRSTGTLVARGSAFLDNKVRGEGASGGAIYNEGGQVTVVKSRFSGNRAERAGGAIEALGGTTSVRQSQLVANATGLAPGNGGAVHLTGEGTVNIISTTVSGNAASAEGGGLWNSADGILNVDRSKIVANNVQGNDADQGGGGIYNDGGTVNVVRSIVDRNIASGISGSGGGIFNNLGTLNVTSTSVSANSATRAGGGIEALGGTTALRAARLLGNGTGANPGNGGGLHLTGEGAVFVLGSQVIGNDANAEGGGLWNSAGGTMLVNNTVVQDNRAEGNDPDQGGGGLYNEGGDLTVTSSQVTDNLATGVSGSGGGLFNNNGTLTVGGTTVDGNTANRAGGGIEANVGSTTVDDSTLSDNETGAAPGNGGGLHLTGAGTVDVTSSDVTGNTASAEGGGLWNSAAGTFTVDDTTLSGNSAGGNDADQGGGALYTDGGDLTVTGSTINGNSATGTSGSGGGILAKGGTLDVSDTTLSGNDAKRAGGGIETTGDGTAALVDVDFTDNTVGDAPGNGGGLHNGNSFTTTYTGGNVTGNAAANQGGGLWNGSTASLVVNGVTISGNTAPTGADVYNQPPGGVFTIDGAPVPPTV